MSNSIKWRMVTIYVLMVIIVLIVSGSMIVWLTSKNEYDTLKKDIIYTANLTKEVVDPEAEPQKNGEILKLTIKQNNNTYSDKKLYLLNKEGDVIFPDKEANGDYRFYYPQVMAALNGEKLQELDNVNMKDYEYVLKGYAEPIIYKGQVEYVIYVLASTEKIMTSMQRTIGVIVLSMVLAIIMAGILGIFFSGFLTKPISVLSKKAQDMASGNLDNPILNYSKDEIGQLTNNFNTMAASLKETMEQISSEKNKLEIVFFHMTDGILVFDRKGNLGHTNPASVDMLGIVKQSSYSELFGEYTEAKFEEVFEKAMKGTVHHIIQVGDKYYNISFARFLSHSETQTGMICVIQDITEHKKLEEMQKEFVANVSHELRTPLTTIKSYTETLLDGAMEEKEIAQNFLNVINYEGDRMTALVQDLLDLSRLDNKQTTFIMEELNLNLLLEESIEKFLLTAQKKNQELNYLRSIDTYRVLGDANRIEQVFKNIISNAIKYSPEGAKITTAIYKEQEMAVVKIQDTGFGIPKEDLPRIFERFYRVDKARSREMGGTGLGLAIAKEIMEYLGGSIQISSELGKGSVFYLKFPLIMEKNR